MLGLILVSVVGAETGSFQRVLWGCMFALVVALFTEKWEKNPIKIFKGLIYGPISIGFPFFFLFHALKIVPSSLASLLNGLMPSVVMLMLLMRGKNLHPVLCLIGGGLSFLGVALLTGDISSYSSLEFGMPLFIGIGFAMLMNLFYSIGNVYYEELHPKLPMFQSLFWILFGSSISLFFAGGAKLESLNLVHDATANAAVLGIVNTALAFKIFYVVREKYGSVFSSYCTLIAPFVSTGISLFMGEIQFSYSYIVALLIIVASMKVCQIAIDKKQASRFLKRFKIKVIKLVTQKF
jgi:drug/metabolite transporter (DMT)-like permease